MNPIAQWIAAAWKIIAGRTGIVLLVEILVAVGALWSLRSSTPLFSPVSNSTQALIVVALMWGISLWNAARLLAASASEVQAHVNSNKRLGTDNADVNGRFAETVARYEETIRARTDLERQVRDMSGTIEQLKTSRLSRAELESLLVDIEQFKSATDRAVDYAETHVYEHLRRSGWNSNTSKLLQGIEALMDRPGVPSAVRAAYLFPPSNQISVRVMSGRPVEINPRTKPRLAKLGRTASKLQSASSELHGYIGTLDGKQ